MGGKVVPIEVKSGKAYKAHKALTNYMEIPDCLYLPVFLAALIRKPKRRLKRLKIWTSTITLMIENPVRASMTDFITIQKSGRAFPNVKIRKSNIMKLNCKDEGK